MNTDKFIELVLELGISEKEGFDYKIKSDVIEIVLPSCSNVLRLDSKNINLLYNGKLIQGIEWFSHHFHCGFSFDNYAEFLIKFHYSDYSAQGWEDLWLDEEKFIFSIDKHEIEISKTSPYFILFLGNYYFDLDEYYEHLSNSATIKIKYLNKSKPEKIPHQSLYYLNSSFFEKLNLSISLRHILSDYEFDEFFNLKERLTKIFKHKVQKKIIVNNIEPLIIFNHAVTLSGENQFLGFYRVLEYYFDRYKLNKIKDERFNTKISDEDLIKVVALKGEFEHLKGLLNEIVGQNSKIQICNKALEYNLIKKKDFDSLIKELYNFRNSILHSKESQIEFTDLPDQFNIFRIELLKSWSKIVKILSNIAINKFNK